MQRICLRRVILSTMLCLWLGCVTLVPAYALLGQKSNASPTLSDVTRNVVIGQALTFRAEDFPVSGRDELAALTITTLPEPSIGVLTIGAQEVTPGTMVHAQALRGLCFQPTMTTTAKTVNFTVTPTFSSGTQGAPANVNIHLLAAENQPPIAENFSLQTYKNVAITGYFQAQDADDDVVSFRLTSSPARGSVAIREDGSGSFVYTPYENKTGKDSFSYVAVDSAGNVSNSAKVSIRIEKARTRVTYADMSDHPAHYAAMRLAEEGLLVGEQVNGLYFFAPDAPVDRDQFLAMAMSVAGLEPLEQVSLTGFFDDESIPAWSKGYVSSAVMNGAVTGRRGADGQPIFCPDHTITRGEAVAILDHLLDVSEVAVQTWSAAGIDHGAQDHWAMQPAADLACAGILSLSDSDPEQLDALLCRADVAQLLASSLDLLETRNNKWF